jgi:hypothetical protein
MGLAAKDADDRIGQLLVLTDRLTGLLAAETRAFEARRPQDAAASSEETQRLANLYRHEAARIRADPGLIEPASADLRRQLVAATRSFEAVLARHGRALQAAKLVTEGLVQSIAAEVAAARGGPPGYGPTARAGQVDGTSITLNKRA